MPSPSVCEPAQPALRARDAALAVALALALTVVTAIALVVFGHTAPDPLVLLATSETSAMLAALLVLRARQLTLGAAMPMRAPHSRALVAALLLGSGSLLVSGSLSARLYATDPAGYASELTTTLVGFANRLGPLGLLLLLGVLVPLAEELLFRGVVLHALLARFSPASAILGSAVLFGLYHLHPVHALITTLLGLACGVAVWRGGSWWLGVVAHGSNNLIACRSILGPPLELGVGWVIPGALALGVGVLLLSPVRRRHPESCATPVCASSRSDHPPSNGES